MTEPSKEQAHRLIRSLAEPGKLQSLVLDLWQRTRIDWSFATDRLQQAFRRETWLGASERRLVAEVLYGMIRHARRIDEALEAGGVKIRLSAPDRERLLAYLILEEALDRGVAAPIATVDWSAVAGIDELIARERKPARLLARTCSLPDWLADKLVADLGDEALSLGRALNRRAPMTVRANRLVNDREELSTRLAAEGISTERCAYADDALTVTTRTNLRGLAAFGEGRFEAQDEGSQLIAELCAPPPKSLVIDYCAGAGGKTLALAAAMHTRGRLIATDIDERKLTELRRRAKRAKVTNVQAVAISPAENEAWPSVIERNVGMADLVLVDAPCSGIGALRRHPEVKWRLTEDDVDHHAGRQRSITSRALSLVKPGGRLVYATCTMLSQENRQVVDHVLSTNPAFELVRAYEVWGEDRAKAICDTSGTYLEVLPHRHGTDGFFAAVLQRRPTS